MNSIESEPRGRSVLQVLRRRRLPSLITFVVFLILSTVFALFYRNYGALTHVLLVNDLTGRSPTDAGVDMPTIVTGSTVLLEVQQRLRLSDSLTEMRKAVSARIPPKSSLMTIAVHNHDAALAMRIDNAIADSFVNLYYHLARDRYDEVLKRLDVDVQAARGRVRRLDRQLEAASAGSTYVGSQNSLDAGAAHLSELAEAKGVAEAALATDNADLRADIRLPAKTATFVRSEILRNNVAYSQTEAVVSKDFAEYTASRAGTTGAYPGMAGFKDRVKKEGNALDKLRNSALSGRDAYSESEATQIIQRARDGAAVEGDQVKLAAYNSQISSLYRRLNSQHSGVSSLGALRAERDTAESQFQTLATALSNAQASSAQASSLGQIVIVDRATEARPVLLSTALMLVLGVLVSVGLAVLVAYLYELTVPVLLDPRDVENIYGRPILGNLSR